jgi:hypothetical protein
LTAKDNGWKTPHSLRMILICGLINYDRRV